jgi:AcrR family transcriptional regulator
MARWDADGRGRLHEAAMALYAERGFQNTTVAEIAERAGLTERTFFRHFADKREVLFAGSEEFQELLVGTVARAPESLPPLAAVATGLEAVSRMLQERREFSRVRQAIIDANPELQERELIKLASLGAALAEVLRKRGVDEPAASLTAEVGIAAFRVAYEQWHREKTGSDLSQLVTESLDQLRTLSGRA